MTTRVSFEFGAGTLEWAIYVQKLPALVEKQAAEALDQGTAAVLNRLRQTYLAEQDPDGSSWIPSAAGTQRKNKGGPGTMFDTGNLFRSIQLYRDSELERTIGTDVEYARWHNEGTGGQTKRTFLGLTEGHKALVESIFLRKLKLLTSINP